MKNWDTLTPDVTRLMNRHYTPGRAGRPPLLGAFLYPKTGRQHTSLFDEIVVFIK